LAAESFPSLPSLWLCKRCSLFQMTVRSQEALLERPHEHKEDSVKTSDSLPIGKLAIASLLLG
jgi:hypothetical protein